MAKLKLIDKFRPNYELLVIAFELVHLPSFQCNKTCLQAKWLDTLII